MAVFAPTLYGTNCLAPPFPAAAMQLWRRQQDQLEEVFAALPWSEVLPCLLKSSASYSSARTRSERLWEGQALILHGATDDPLGVEQFGFVVKVGRYICCQPGYSTAARANDARAARVPLTRRLLADVKRLRQWMHNNPPAAPLWAPCCGHEGQRLALLLGLRVVEHRGTAWAAWASGEVE